MANKNQLLNIGDRLDLYLGSGPTYRTKLEDVTKEGCLLVSVPTYKGVPMDINKGQGLQLYFYRDNGRFRANIRVVEFHQIGGLRLMELKLLSEPQKQQRRDSYRLPADLKVKIQLIENDSISDGPISNDNNNKEEASSINISATGISIKTKRQYSVGDKVLMRIYLKWPEVHSEPLEVLGEVRQTDILSPIDKTYSTGIMFLYTSNDIYGLISRFVMIMEQKRLKQKRLVEGE